MGQHEFANELGGRIRQRRTKLGYSQERLAEAAGLHWSYVSSVERGERNPTLGSVLKLAHGLGVDPAKLVAGLTID